MKGASVNLDLLRLLDATAAFNSHFADDETPEPEPEGTGGFRVDGLTAARIARDLGLYPPFVWEVFGGLPVKHARRIRDWVLARERQDPAFDAVFFLACHAEKQGVGLSEGIVEEAREANGVPNN